MFNKFLNLKVLRLTFALLFLGLAFSFCQAAASDQVAVLDTNSAITAPVKSVASVYGTLPGQVVKSYSDVGQSALNVYQKAGETIWNATENISGDITPEDQSASVISSVGDFFRNLFNKLFNHQNSSSTATTTEVLYLSAPKSSGNSNKSTNSNNNTNSASITTTTTTTTSPRPPAAGPAYTPPSAPTTNTTIIQNGVSETELNQKLAALNNSLQTQIYNLTNSSNNNSTAPVINQYITYGGGGVIGSFSGASNSDIQNLQTQINNIVAGGGGGNPFNQSLNTTDSPTFNSLTLSGLLNVNGAGTSTFSGNVNVGGNVTATAFYGDGSHLTGISGGSPATSTIRGMFSATPPLTYDSSTGIFGITKASSTADGYLSSTDWNTFNNKQAAGTYLTSLNGLTAATQTFATSSTGTDFSITSSGSTHTFNLPSASASSRGLLTAADWSIFNGKQAAGNYITALTGDGTASGPGSAALTLATVNSNVGTFNNVTVNAKGLVTAASNAAYLTGNQTITLTGDVTGSGATSIVTTLKNTGTAGTYRSVTTDAQGRVTAGTNPTTFAGYGISDSSANLKTAITDETGSGALVFANSPTLITPTFATSVTVPLIIGGTGAASTLTLQPTSGNGGAGSDIIFDVGNNGATEAMRILHDGNVDIGNAVSKDMKLNIQGGSLGGIRVTQDDGSTYGLLVNNLDYDPTGAQRFGIGFWQGDDGSANIDVAGDTALTIFPHDVGFGNTTDELTYNGTVFLPLISSTGGLGGSASALCLDDTSFEVQVNTGSSDCSASSERFKHDIENSNAGLDELLRFRPVSFKFNNDSDNNNHLGFIAEEVEQIDPRLVFYGSDGLVHGVRYDEVTSLLAKAIQELNQKVDGQNASTTAALASLDLRVKALEGPSLNSVVYSNNGGSGLGDSILSTLQSFGSEIMNGISYLSNLFTKHLTVGSPEHPNGVTLYDQVNGEPYCLSISNGQTKTTAGQCSDAVYTAPGTQTPPVTPPADDPPADTGTSTDATSTPPEDTGKQPVIDPIAPPVTPADPVSN